MTPRRFAYLCFFGATILAVAACADPVLYGTWRFDAERSTDIAPWKGHLPHLEIRDDGDAVTIIHDW